MLASAIKYALLGLLLVCGAFAQADSCVPTLGNGNQCSANDLVPSSSVVSGPQACTEGDIISVTLRVRFGEDATRAATERYDIGIFVGDFGGEAITDDPAASCTFASLAPLAPPLDLFGGSGGYRDLDGDACGDLQRDEDTYREMVLDRVLCQDSNGDGEVDINYAITWSTNRNQDVCPDPNVAENFIPEQSSKCRSEEGVNLPILVEPPPSIAVSKTATPAEVESGDSVTYRVVVLNTSSATDPVTITDLDDDIYGSLNARGSCSVPPSGIEIQPGATYSCSFTETIVGTPADPPIVDVVTAQGSDNEGVPVTASDDAAVQIVAGPPAAGRLAIGKLASPRQLPEPGGTATFTVVAANLSRTSVTLNSLVDDIYGDLDGQGSCELPQTLSLASPFYICRFDGAVTGVPGDIKIDVITGTGVDAFANPLQDSAQASVRIYDLSSDIRVVKSASRNSVPDDDRSVSYSVTVTNISEVDEVVVGSLVDNIHGNLQGQGDCQLPQRLSAAGGQYSCRFPATVVAPVDSVETDTILALGIDDDGQVVADSDSASVLVLAGPVVPPQPPQSIHGIPVMDYRALLLLALLVSLLAARRLVRSAGP